MRQPDREWVQDKLSDLTAHIDELQEIGDEVDDPEFGPWTALKLVVLTATVDVYTTVISKNDFNHYYVDAMSGSGIVGLNDREEMLIGSAIIAGTVAHEPFEKMYLIETDERRAAALRDRLKYAAENIDSFTQPIDSYEVLVGDANDLLPTVPDRIESHRGGSARGYEGEGGQHHLAFIDNERSDIEFSSIRQLERIWGDLLINYQETGLNRERGRLEEGLSDDWDEFVAFFDEDRRVLDLKNPEDRFNLYLEKLDSIDRPIHESVRIQGSSAYPYGYRMVYAVRRSSGGSEFTQFMDGQRRKIEGLTGDEIDTVLDTMRGSVTHLGLWSLDKDEDGQSRLGSF
jgi:three-Cys-motif partner protein